MSKRKPVKPINTELPPPPRLYPRLHGRYRDDDLVGCEGNLGALLVAMTRVVGDMEQSTHEALKILNMMWSTIYVKDKS